MSKFRILKERTTEVLAGAAVFTSQSYNFEQYNHVRGLVQSDQGGTLVIQQSDDGITWVQTNSITVTGGTDTKFDDAVCAYYVRVEYTNGVTDQTSFNLSLYADPFN